MYACAWALGLLMLSFFAYLLLKDKPGVNSKITIVRASERGRLVKVAPNKFNHFVLPCELNGVKTKCLLDTGATYVSVPAQYEKPMGLKRGFTFNVSTGNGDVRVYATRIDLMLITGFELKDVKATINPTMKSEYVLLGMSALKYLKWRMEGHYLMIGYR